MNKEALVNWLQQQQKDFLAEAGQPDVEATQDFNEGFQQGVQAFAAHLITLARAEG